MVATGSFGWCATSPAAVGVHPRPSVIPWWHRAFLTPSVSLSFLLGLLVFFPISHFQLNVFHPCPFHLQLESTGREKETLV